MRPTGVDERVIDLVVIGGGPAGMSAALVAGSYGEAQTTDTRIRPLASLVSVARVASQPPGTAPAGVMLGRDGLRPTSQGARVRFEGDKHTVVDGPFTEAKEIDAGFWLWECSSRDEALEWLKRAPFDGGTEIELREIAELDDFDEELTRSCGRPTSASGRSSTGTATIHPLEGVTIDWRGLPGMAQADQAPSTRVRPVQCHRGRRH